jgi:GNAT superfamily N-acetyltransferase
MAPLVRVRCDGDLEECLRVLEAVYRADRYPFRWPEDPAGWLSPRAMLGAWVAGDGGRVLGHVALRAVRATDGGAPAWSGATGLPAEGHASVSRLFVSPGSRGAGLGRSLLDTARAESAGRGLHPALSVVETDADAVRLYERNGWRRVLSESFPAFPEGEGLLYLYVFGGAST